LDVYEFDFLAQNVVVPFKFKEEFGYEESLARSKQTLLIFAQGEEVVKSFVVRYHYSGLEETFKNIKEISYDRLNWKWKGQIQLYSLNEIHLVSFNILNGKVLATETMEIGEEEGFHSSISASYTCTITWTPGPCEPDPTPEGPGVACHDVFTSTCYYDQPPLLIGYPIWTGSGGFGSSGSGIPGDQYLCDFDPSCIPHPDLVVEGESLIQNFIEGLIDPEEKRRAQLDYLRTHGGRDFSEFVEELINSGGLSMGDISEINNMVNSVYFNQKGLFMMAIFSPQNFEKILFLISSNISSTLRNRVFNFLPTYASRQGVNILIPLGRGSTGRVIANNLTEQLAMKEAMSNPSSGTIIIQSINDSRWLGWSKMQFIHTGQNGIQTIIHYVGKWENGILIYIDDFKFIN
jgi:hypothetical protein